LFAASLSLAPLIAFIILVIDIRVDAKRLLWIYRRPVAYIAQDLGQHFIIVIIVIIIVIIIIISAAAAAAAAVAVVVHLQGGPKK